MGKAPLIKWATTGLRVRKRALKGTITSLAECASEMVKEGNRIGLLARERGKVVSNCPRGRSQLKRRAGGSLANAAVKVSDTINGSVTVRTASAKHN
jgi:hypothetical protein